MKFMNAIVALIATAAAADASDWAACTKGGDCAGKFACCAITGKDNTGATGETAIK